MEILKNKINNDILLIIFEYNPLLFYINKEFYNYRKKYLDVYANKIKKWFQYYSIFYINLTEDMKLTKKLLIKYYMFDYPKQYLLDYPEFLVEKCFNINLNNNTNILNQNQQTILNILINLPPINKRKTYDIYNFMKSDIISKNMIEYTGW